ncbi:MAG: hypothetical protein JW863_24085 [Chitinispirillaceae bacterium]|nr:hypothetical protein [Chitinispirillaceae bacterium]
MTAGPRQLRAGPLRCMFANGILRSIRYGEHEAVRRVYMALRDRYWNSVPFSIEQYSLAQKTDSFELSFIGVHRTVDIGFRWQCAITGKSSGEIELSMRGVATTTFLRNRIGWCVLHPLTCCKGTPCTLVHTDGSSEQSVFPGETIAPHQPFLDLREMTYPVVSGVHCTLRFSGDIFETEDQRNWTDATFKTYSTPQKLPVPVEVPEGTVIEQRVHIRIEGPAIQGDPGRPAPAIDVNDLFTPFRPVPQTGVRHPPDRELPERVAGCLRKAGIAHLRCEIRPAEDSAGRQLPEMIDMAGKAGCGLECAVHFSEHFQEELQWLVSRLKTAASIPLRLLLYSDRSVVTPESLVRAAVETGKPMLPNVGVFAGTDRYFVEVNRAHAPVDLIDGVCFSANPQVHTFDGRAVMENVEGLAECIRTARHLYKGKTICLSPLTMRPRKDPHRPQKDGGADPRQRELFGAAWLTASIGACVNGGVDVLTVLAATGPEGLMNEDGTLLFPVYHIIASGCRATAAASVRIAAGESLCVAVSFAGASRRTVLIANCAAEAVSVRLQGVPDSAMLAVLDDTTAGRAGADPQFWMHEQRIPEKVPLTMLELSPYAVARLEFSNE